MFIIENMKLSYKKRDDVKAMGNNQEILFIASASICERAAGKMF